jgi:hypothetical protein
VSEPPTLDYATPPKRQPSYAFGTVAAILFTISMLVLTIWALGPH